MSHETRLISEEEVGDPGRRERTRPTVVAEEPLRFLLLHPEEGPQEVVNDGPQENDQQHDLSLEIKHSSMYHITQSYRSTHISLYHITQSFRSTHISLYHITQSYRSTHTTSLSHTGQHTSGYTTSLICLYQTSLCQVFRNIPFQRVINDRFYVETGCCLISYTEGMKFRLLFTFA